MKYIDFKAILSGLSLKKLLYSVVFGLVMLFLFSGKSRVTLEAITVSPDEQYIACFETGNGYKIHCFHADGTLAFDFNVAPDVSAGGHCTLWFENNILCVLFYRTNKIVYFALDGTILNVADNAAEEYPPEYPSFSRKGQRYIFDGAQIDVVYNKGSFLGYWFLAKERSLSVTYQNGERKVLYAWTAAEGAEKKTN